MQIIDTHSHMYASQFSDDINEAIQRAKDSGVIKIVLPNIDHETISDMDKLSKDFPELFVPLIGLHPTSIDADFENILDKILKHADTAKYKGIGEIGIDLYWDKTFFEQQRIAFIRQVKFAIEKDLPFIIHARDSFDEIFEALEEINIAKYKGIFHAFTGTEEQANKIIEMGFLLGIGGIVTFKNSGLAENIKNISLKHFVLETDSPYLAPVPYRGKRNESSYVKLVAEKIAEIKQVTLNDVAGVTTQNAVELFKL